MENLLWCVFPKHCAESFHVARHIIFSGNSQYLPAHVEKFIHVGTTKLVPFTRWNMLPNTRRRHGFQHFSLKLIALLFIYGIPDRSRNVFIGNFCELEKMCDTFFPTELAEFYQRRKKHSPRRKAKETFIDEPTARHSSFPTESHKYVFLRETLKYCRDKNNDDLLIIRR